LEKQCKQNNSSCRETRNISDATTLELPTITGTSKSRDSHKSWKTSQSWYASNRKKDANSNSNEANRSEKQVSQQQQENLQH
jgi:hypothetical protein